MASTPSPSEQRKPLVVYAPFIFGGAALLFGLALGVGRCDSETTAESAAGGPSATEAPVAPSASADAERPAYLPDLSGDDVAKLIVKTDEPAAGLARVGGRLVWLASEGSRLSQVLPAGGQPEELFAVESDDQFGGSMTHDDNGVYWVVEHMEGGNAPVYFLAPPRGKPRVVAKGSSPDHLVVVEGKLHWSDRGSIMRLADEPQVLVKRERRIAALTGDERGIYWLEIDYESSASGAHQLMMLGPEDEEPRQLDVFKRPQQRSLLVIRGDELVWVEGQPGEGWALRAHSRKHGSQRTLALTGEVSAVALHQGSLYWAEAHRAARTQDEVVTVLRRLGPPGAKNSNDAERLGRTSGAVTALLPDATSLFVGGSRGIAVVPLE